MKTINMSRMCEGCGITKPLWKFEKVKNTDKKNLCTDCLNIQLVEEFNDSTDITTRESLQKPTDVTEANSEIENVHNELTLSNSVILEDLKEELADKPNNFLNTNKLLLENNFIEINKLGDKAVEPLIEALKNDNNLIRKNSVIALGKIKNANTVQHLINTLNDIDPDVRLFSAESLSYMGDYIIDPLIELLDDEKDNLRMTAVELLSKVGNESIINPFIKLLNDKNVFIRIKVIEILGILGDDSVINPLIKSLEDKNYMVRKTVAEVLGDIGNSKCVDPLKKVCEIDTSVVKITAESAIIKIESRNEKYDMDSINSQKKRQIVL